MDLWRLFDEATCQAHNVTYSHRVDDPGMNSVASVFAVVCYWAARFSMVNRSSVLCYLAVKGMLFVKRTLHSY